MKRKVYQVLEAYEKGDRLSRVCDLFLIVLILLNVIAAVVDTVDRLYGEYRALFDAFELFSVIVFSVEYLLRLWSCTTDERYRHPVAGRIRFAFTALAIVDFLAIAPTIVTYAVPTLSGADLRFVRAVRLFRIFRLLKIGRYSDTLQHLGTVLIAKREELVLSVCIALVLLVLCSSGMYLVERNAQPEKFGSIPAAMWWGVSTLTTVGYGDVLPTTVPGKFLGAAIAIIGVGMFALPAGILAGGFNEALSKRKRRQTCPHCGKSVDGEG